MPTTLGVSDPVHFSGATDLGAETRNFFSGKRVETGIVDDHAHSPKDSSSSGHQATLRKL